MKAMRKHSLLILFFPVFLHAQFRYQGFGIFGSFTHSAHRYVNQDTEKKATDTIPYTDRYFYPQSHVSMERLSWGAGAFVELGGDNIRWQTELEYINKGAKENDLTNRYTGDRVGTYVPNKYQYIQWNNYVKLWYRAGAAHWYLLPGVRLEYLYGSSTPVFASVSGAFPKFWFSGNLGIGYEIHLFRKISAFIEYHWNPDIISHKHDNTTIRNRTFELRLGLVMRPKKRSVDDCNAPVYKGPAY
jgi:hypothetical protein